MTKAASKKAIWTLVDDNTGLRFFGREIAVGNFDNMETSTADPSQKERNPNLQLAVIGIRVNLSTGDHSTAGLAIYDVTTNPAPTFPRSYTTLDASYFGGNTVDEMSIVAGDLQGRSYRLGPPSKLTIDSAIQPMAITAMPPMHADFIMPANSPGRTLFNMSFVPSSFNTQYAMADTTSTNSSDTKTTSWSFGAKVSVSAGNEIGDVEAGDGTKWQDTFTASAKIKQSTATLHGTYSSYNFSLQTQTEYGDNVFYSETRFNIWVYPVLGRKVCPAGKPNCADSEKVPLTIQFSAPDQIDNPPVAAGPTLEWYQPPWEPGNIFSYPGNFSQLQQIIGMDPITGQPTIDVLSESVTFSADSSKLAASANWENGQTDGSTTNTSAKFSFENDFSFTAAGGCPSSTPGPGVLTSTSAGATVLPASARV